MGNSASRQPVAYANVEADEADQQQVTIEVQPATEQARTGAGGIGATSTVSVAALLDDSDVPERARYHEDEEEEYDDEEDEDEEDDNEEDDEEDEEHYDNERAGRQRTTPMTGAATATQQQQQQQQRTQAMHAMEPFLMNARDLYLSRLLNPPQMHRMQTVKAMVNLIKDSLVIVPSPTNNDSSTSTSRKRLVVAHAAAALDSTTPNAIDDVELGACETSSSTTTTTTDASDSAVPVVLEQVLEPRSNCIHWYDVAASVADDHTASEADSSSSSSSGATAAAAAESRSSVRARLRFRFDALEECQIRVMLCATQSVVSGHQVFEPLKQELGEEVHYFPAGLGQVFDSEVDFSYYKLEQLLYKTENPTFYPLVITLQTTRTSGSGKERVVDSQTTFATLVDQQQDGYLSIRPIKVTLECNGQAYNVYDIYGINEEEDSLGIGSECVICMSEDRDTTLLPCRHMCLCGECAEAFRSQTNKCPICRSHVRTLLQIERGPTVSQPANDTDHQPNVAEPSTKAVDGESAPLDEGASASSTLATWQHEQE